MNFFSTLTAGALLAAAALLPASAPAAPLDASLKTGPFGVSVQAYSFNRFTAFEAIDKTAQTGAKLIEFYPGQKLSADGEDKVDQNMSAEATEKLKKHLAEKNIRAIAFGVTGISKDEGEARKLFSWANGLGIKVINTESIDALDTAEKVAGEFDMYVGIHDHPKRANDANYKLWDPNFMLTLVRDRKRVGACADVGHWARSGVRPLEGLRILSGHIVSSHFKDLNEFGKDNAHDMPWGTGISQAKEMLDELKKQGFEGPMSVEYEYNWDNSVPEIAQCVAFVRGWAAAQPAK